MQFGLRFGEARRAFRAALSALIVLAVLAGSVGIAADADAARTPKLFGTREIKSDKLGAFPKWTGMLKRYFRVNELPEGDCKARKFNKCHLDQWERFIAALDGRDPKIQIREVNGYMNRAPYITDLRNYGVKDYWATPHQFRIRNGDCEDYAIAKYMSLRALGFNVSKMRVAVVKDLNLRTAHAVLAVYHDGQALILDNQTKSVISSKRIRHYKIYYSINEKNWWLHRSSRR